VTATDAELCRDGALGLANAVASAYFYHVSISQFRVAISNA